MQTPREKRLPVWAQDELRVLRMRIDELEKALSTLGGAEPTGFAMSDHTRVIHAPDGWHGVFWFPRAEEGEVEDRACCGRVRVSLRDGAVYVNADRKVTIEPAGASCFYVKEVV